MRISDWSSDVCSSDLFDRLPERIGLGHAFAAPAAGVAGELDAPAGVGTSPSATPPGLTLSDLVGKIALFFIMLFATVEAAAMLGFAGVHELLEMFIAFGEIGRAHV